MPRRVNQAAREARRREIRDAAVKTFARQGLDATTLADIARVVGITHPTILNYFASKDELFAAAVLEPLEQFGTALLPREAETLQVLVERHVNLFMAQSAYLRLAQSVLPQAERFPSLAAELRAFTERLRDMMVPMMIGAGCKPNEAPRRFWGYFAQLIGMGIVLDNTPQVRQDMIVVAGECLGIGMQCGQYAAQDSDQL
jgi:AcrR family transcriptional regulator